MVAKSPDPGAFLFCQTTGLYGYIYGNNYGPQRNDFAPWLRGGIVPDDAYFEAGDGTRLYTPELVTDVLEMPGLTEDELFAVMEQQPALYGLMSAVQNGDPNGPRAALLVRVKAAIARRIGLCMVHDYPMVPAGDSLYCDECALEYGERLASSAARVAAGA